MSLAPFGLALFSGDALMTDRSFTLLHCLDVLRSDLAIIQIVHHTTRRSFTLLHCLDVLRSDLAVIQFVDDHISRTLDVRLLLPPTGMLYSSGHRHSLIGRAH